MKRVLLIGLMLLLVLSCLPVQALNKVRPIVIGILYDPPFVYNSSTGFDVEMMTNICTSQKMECRFVLTTLNAAFVDLRAKTGQLDAAVGAISITAQRANVFAFVGPYYQGTMSLLARQGQFNERAPLSAFLKQSIGVEKDSTFYHYLAEAAKTDEYLKIYEDSNEMLQALADEEVDAIALDSPVAKYWQQKSHCKLQVVGPAVQIPYDEGYGIVLRLNDTALKTMLSQGLQKIQTEGALARLIHLYFSDSLSYCIQ